MAAMISLAVARQGFLSDMIWLNKVGTCPGNTSSSAVLKGVFLDSVEGVKSFLGTGSL